MNNTSLMIGSTDHIQQTKTLVVENIVQAAKLTEKWELFRSITVVYMFVNACDFEFLLDLVNSGDWDSAVDGLIEWILNPPQRKSKTIYYVVSEPQIRLWDANKRVRVKKHICSLCKGESLVYWPEHEPQDFKLVHESKINPNITCNGTLEVQK